MIKYLSHINLKGVLHSNRIILQSLEDVTQVGYISQKYTLDKNTFGKKKLSENTLSENTVAQKCSAAMDIQ